MLGLGIFSSHFRFSLERQQGGDGGRDLRLLRGGGEPGPGEGKVPGAGTGGSGREVLGATWGFGCPPSTVESSYLYPYMPQKRRAGSKARVMKTRMTTRTHMGRTSGQPGERKEH